MNYLQHLLHSKGKANLASRALQIVRRFGLTSSKITKDLQLLHEITTKHGCTPTIFLTADLLDREGDLIRRISENGTRFGVHGHYHIDFASLSAESQSKGIAMAVDKFTRHRVPANGFRGPFLRYNSDTSKAVKENGLSWASHSVMVIDPGDGARRINASTSARNLIKNFYSQESYQKTPSLPSWGEECLEIPVSLPDDEVLVDRLGIRDSREISGIWADMLNTTSANEELLNLLIHPERRRIVAESLDHLLEHVGHIHNLWMTSLDDIARWWQERSAFSFQVVRNSPTSWRITPRCKPRAAVIIQEPGGARRAINLDKDDSFPLYTTLRPSIHMPPGFCDRPTPCLVNEGFLVERDSDPSTFSFALTGTCPKDVRTLLAGMKQAKGPLVSFGRWPKPFTSALAVSMDLDAFTLWDFVRRVRQFRAAQSGSDTPTPRP